MRDTCISVILGRIYWLGGSDLVTEGEWQWTSEQETFKYTNWMPKEPNNLTGEDCLLNNWLGHGKWGDFVCERTEYFVCQIELVYNFNILRDPTLYLSSFLHKT